MDKMEDSLNQTCQKLHENDPREKQDENTGSAAAEIGRFVQTTGIYGVVQV